MIPTGQRTVAAVLCLTAFLTPARSTGEPAAAARFNVQVIVHDCYRASAARVFIDGRPLALIPPGRRDDTVAICYNGAAVLGPRAQVRVLSQGRDRRVDLIPDAQSRFLLIAPDRPPYAHVARDAPLLD